MDYLQQYASLRHREVQGFDVMGECLVHCQYAGLVLQPWYQTLRIVNWRGTGQSSATIKVDTQYVTFMHWNIEGQEVHRSDVRFGDRTKLTKELDHLCEHVLAVVHGQDVAT